MSDHTPTPWELFHPNGVIAIKNPRARSSKNEIIFWSGFDASHYPKQALANAAFIVKAVNNHQQMVKTLEALRDDPAVPEWIRTLATGSLASVEPSTS